MADCVATVTVNVEGNFLKIKELILDAIRTDGAHHKQEYLFKIAEELKMSDICALKEEYL